VLSVRVLWFEFSREQEKLSVNSDVILRCLHWAIPPSSGVNKI